MVLFKGGAKLGGIIKGFYGVVYSFCP